MTTNVRHYPRYKWNACVGVTNADGLSMEAHSRNISSEGMHLIFDQASAQRIVPSGFVPSPTQPIELDISINEPGRKRLFLVGQVRGVRRLAQDAFSFHMEFVRLTPEVGSQLSDFISTLSLDS